MSKNPRLNPYIGPRAFQQGERLYGRGREVSKLLNLLIAERIVLLYSPSGAGKTSLLQAALIPELRNAGFQVPPPIRVGLEPSSALDSSLSVNRYLFSTLFSLEEEGAPEHQMPLEELAGLPLSSYLERREDDTRESARSLIIFDQFEEVLTVDPLDLPAKKEFFTQLGQALRRRHRWALFAMREEYLAGLDPFLRFIPTRLRTTFRLDLLDEYSAAQAIQEPAIQAGVRFREEAVIKLSRDLRSSKFQSPDGRIEERIGPNVDPVQLQVVCHRLWEQLPEETDEIGEADIQEAGDVDSALAGYYAGCVNTAARGSETLERKIREWVDQRLITSQGIRGQVLKESDLSQGLDNRVIECLIDAYLVRTENRRGATWYELAHDRLIAPVKKDNAAWRETHLGMLQRQAALWDRQNRPTGLLLRDDALKEAETWADEHHNELTSDERDFLSACREAQAMIERERRQTRRIRRLAITSTLISIIAIIALIFAILQQQLARKNEKLAQTRALETEREREKRTNSLFESHLIHASLLARNENYAAARIILNESRSLDKDIPAERRHSRNLLAWFTELMGGTPSQTYIGAGVPLFDVAVSPDNHLLAAVGEKGTVVLFDADNGDLLKRLSGHADTVWAVVFQPQGHWFATAGDDRRIIFWSPSTGEKLDEMNAPDKLYALALSPDGTLLASGGSDNNITLWDTTRKKVLQTLKGHSGLIRGLTFSPNGRLLASASTDNTARIWDLKTGKTRHELTEHTNCLNEVVFHPSENVLATSSDDKSVRLWEVSSGKPLRVLSGHSDEVNGLVFMESGNLLVSASRDRTLRVWDYATGTTLGVLQGHKALIDRIKANAGQIFSASGDQTLIRWDVRREIFPGGIRLSGLPDKPVASAIAPDGSHIAVGSAGGTIRLYTLPDARPVWEHSQASVEELYSVAFSPDSRLLVASLGRFVKLWQVSDGRLYKSFEVHKETSRVTFSPNGKYLAFAGFDGRIGLLEINHAKGSFYKAHDGVVRSVNFDSRGQHLLSAGDDGETRLWKLDRWPPRLLKSFPKARGEVLWAAFDQDDEYIVTVGRDMFVHLFSVKNSTEEQRLEGHANLILRAAFSPDGGQVASVSTDTTIRFWDLKQRMELFTLRLPATTRRDVRQDVPLLDFDFRCTNPATADGKCWIAIPLIRGELMLYHLGQPYE